MRFLTCAASALLVELDDLNQTLTLLNLLQQNPINGVIELVPAARTILVQFKPYLVSANALQKQISRCDLSQNHQNLNIMPTVEIPVIYNGEDLENVAQMLSVTPDEIITQHTQTKWQAAFLGFAPGFAYLTSDNPLFDKIARHKTPRVAVPAGSVALADNFSAVYPNLSPGGWQLIGITNLKMWDELRQTPALLQPGSYVQFTKQSTFSGYTKSTTSTLKTEEPQAKVATNSVLVKKTGMLTIWQDLGRYGFKNQGVGVSGAMDKVACITANKIVGNDVNCAVLENIGQGLTLQSVGNCVITITGAKARLTLKDANNNSWQVSTYQALALNDGEQISVTQIEAGLRNYIAVRGGFKVNHILNSVSTDILAKVGPPPISAGQLLAIKKTLNNTSVQLNELAPHNLPTSTQTVELDLILGPRDNWFDEQSIQLLTRQKWQVTPQSNRIGLRLMGEKNLVRTINQELPSEGLVCGAVQIPASGQPIIFLRDHPLTGGYPIIGCIAEHHLDLAGQIPCAAYIRFNILNLN